MREGPRSARRWYRGPGRVFLLIGLLVLGAPAISLDAKRPVDLELVLAVDASGSVDFNEFSLQMEGLIRAFRDPAVVAAIHGTGPNGIAVTVMQWSSAGEQRQMVPWTRLHDAASAHAFSAEIAAQNSRQFNDSTGIGTALRYAERLIRRNRFEGRRKSIDISGDGVNNSGIPPDIVRDLVIAAGVTINGLAILNEQPQLHRYFASDVIGGAGAFVMTVDSYAGIIEATRAKLLREISINVAEWPARQPPRN